jgi:pimeloyl-[acyl-carrier protein] methyl ester esterase
MLFLHGFAGSAGLWRGQVEEFSSVAQCVAIDLPGHGRSAWNNETLSDMASQIIEISRREMSGRVHCVASSFGGLVALEAWQQAPEIFSAMTFAGSLPRFTACDGFPAGLNPPRIRKLACQFEGDVGAVLDMFFRSLFTMKEREAAQYDAIKALRRALPLPGREALLRVLDILEQTDLRDVFSTMDVPVQIVSGDQDYLCPLAAVDALRSLNPSAKIDIFKNCGHFPFLSYPQEFNRVVREFTEA